jgi:hypothetical protein
MGLCGLVFLSVQHASIIGDEEKRQRLAKMPLVAHAPGGNEGRMRHEVPPITSRTKRR